VEILTTNSSGTDPSAVTALALPQAGGDAVVDGVGAA